MNRMVLKTNFIVVKNAGTECRILPLALIAHDLSKRAMDNFFGCQVNEGFNIILRSQPLAGGHLVMIVIESIIKKEIPIKIKMAIQNTGLVLLLILMAFIIYNDIISL